MSRGITLVAGGLVWLSAASLPAQEAVLGQMYGTGVHAYFSQDYLKAHEALTAAIDAGTADPRAYYFRGLAYLKVGRPEEAAMDFQKAAELESKDVNKFYNASRALERIQGSTRATLEKYRVAARMAALEDAERLRKARYEEIRRQEARVLQQQIEAAPPAAAGPADKAANLENLDPFANPVTPRPSAQPEARAGAEPADAPATQPAAGPAAPAVTETPAPPGGQPAAAEPLVPRPPGTPAATAPIEDDPFAPAPAKPGSKPAVPPPPGPGGGAKPAGVLGALGKALGKAAVGEAEQPPAQPGAGSTAPAAAPAQKPAAKKPTPPKPAAGDAVDPFAP